MERNPHAKREKKEIEQPYRFKCRGCSNRHETTHDNTIRVNYEKAPWFDHILVGCDENKRPTLKFIPDAESKEWAEQFDTTDEQLDYCDDENIIQHFKNTYKIEDVREYEVTPGQESRLEHFREVLENAPPGFVVGELVDVPQPPKRLNEMWIGE